MTSYKNCGQTFFQVPTSLATSMHTHPSGINPSLDPNDLGLYDFGGLVSGIENYEIIIPSGYSSILIYWKPGMPSTSPSGVVVKLPYELP